MTKNSIYSLKKLSKNFAVFFVSLLIAIFVMISLQNMPSIYLPFGWDNNLNKHYYAQQPKEDVAFDKSSVKGFPFGYFADYKEDKIRPNTCGILLPAAEPEICTKSYTNSVAIVLNMLVLAALSIGLFMTIIFAMKWYGKSRASAK